MLHRLIGSFKQVHIAGLLLIAAIVFNLYALYPEVAIKVPSLNDNALHVHAVERAFTAILLGQDPTDNWMAAASSFGYPLFHYYQNLAYVLSAVFYLPLALVTRGALSLSNWFDGLRYFLLALFPLSIYWSMRRIGFERFVAALAALLSSLVATNGLLGLEYGSYAWRGGGVYTQMWGMWLLPPALAQSWAYLRDERGYFWSVVLIAATVLCHLYMGYILAGSIIGLTLFALPGMLWRLRITRLAFLGIPAAVSAAYFLLPLLLDSTYQTHSIFEPQWHYDSMGAAWTLNALVRGELFDYGRFPALTILATIGFAVCVWNWRDARYRIPVVLFVLWLFVFFGRPTWGALLDVLPLAREVTYHRMINGVHLGGIMLAGIGLAMLWTWAWSYRDRRLLLAPALLTLVLLIPVYQERLMFMAGDAQLMSETRDALNAEEPNIQRLIETLSELPPGRVYAGLPATWGANYKFGSVPMYDVIYAAGLDMLAYPFASFSHNSNLAWGFADGKQEQYNLFNVRYVVTPVGWTVPGYYQTLGDFGKHCLYSVETTGYFGLVDSPYAFVGSKDDFYPAATQWLNSNLPSQKINPGVNLGNAVTTHDYPWIAPLTQVATVIPQTATPPTPVRGRITAEAIESNAYTADVTVESPGMLMLKATYHPNWHALVDGVEQPTTMLMPSFVGVSLTPGVHHVRIEYRPPTYRYLLMLAGWLTFVFVGVFDRRPPWLARLGKYRNSG